MLPTLPKDIILNKDMEPKSVLFVNKIVNYLSDPDQQEFGLSFILNNIDNQTFCDIFLKVHPQVYTQFLLSDNPMLLTTALYIVDALCKRQSFVRLFITQDEHLLNSISNLLNYQNPIIFELSIEILIAFVDQPTELENFESFIPVLLVASSIVSHLRPVIILLLHKILQCEKTQQKFVDSNGLFLIYNTLLAPQDDELFSCLEILLRLEKAKPVYLDAIVNTNILQPLTEIINKEDDMSLVERCLGIVSLLSTSSFFPNICRSSGLFETCLELIEYPYTKTSTVVTLRAALLIIYRTTTNSLLVKSCTSLKLASKLSNLIKNANQFNPQVQMVVYGILANLIESPEAQKDLLVTKVNTILYLIDLKTVIVEAQPIITTALLVFETLQVRDVKEEYTPKDIERIAEYNSQITRNKILMKEFVKSERQYVQQLNLCVAVIIKRMEQIACSKEMISKIFNNIDDLFKFQSAFLEKLQSACTQAKEQNIDFITISGILHNFFDVPMTKMYSIYVNHVEDAIKIFNKLSTTNKSVKELVETFAQTGIFVPTVLLLPIQHPLRYVLHLEQIVKSMPKYLTETKQISIALEKIRKIAHDIEKNKKVSDNKKALELWSTRFDLSPFPNPNREYVTEFPQVLATENKDATVYSLVILSDIALLVRNIGKSTKEKWKVKAFLLSDWKMKEFKDNKITLAKQKSDKTIILRCTKIKDTELLAQIIKNPSKYILKC